MSYVDDAAVERAVRSFAAAMIGLAAHELNNRLAVMRETVGLMEDLARAGKSGAAGAVREQIALGDQVGRALNTVRSLSGLGCALGAAAGSFDVGATLADLLGLTERWARQRTLRVDRAIADALPRAAGDPALFLCLVQRLLAGCAETLAPGGSVRVRASRDGAAIRVNLQATGERAPGTQTPVPSDDGIDAELARRLGGELLFENNGAATLKLAALP